MWCWALWLYAEAWYLRLRISLGALILSGRSVVFLLDYILGRMVLPERSLIWQEYFEFFFHVERIVKWFKYVGVCVSSMKKTNTNTRIKPRNGKDGSIVFIHELRNFAVLKFRKVVHFNHWKKCTAWTQFTRTFPLKHKGYPKKYYNLKLSTSTLKFSSILFNILMQLIIWFLL